MSYPTPKGQTIPNHLRSDGGQVLLRQLGVAQGVAGFDALGQGVDVWQLLQA